MTKNPANPYFTEAAIGEPSQHTTLTAGRTCEGYKAALSVSVFHTMGKICCMEDTMGLGKFFTNAVTA